MRLLGVKLPANGNEARRSPFAPPPAPDAVLASATPPPHRRHVPPPAAPARGRPGLPAPPPPAIPGAGPHLQPLLHPRRLLNSLLPHLTTSHLHLLRLLPFDHLTLLLLSSGPNRHASPLPAASSLHALAVCSGHLPADLRLANSLLARYLALGSHASARRLFADIPRPDAVTWNTLLRACLRSGLLPSARQLFDQMPERDLVSFNSMLSGYAAAGDMAGARELFDGMPERDVVSWNSMLAGYTRCGDMENARRMFDAMPERDVVSWNTMLDGYAQAGDVKMARVVFDDMPRRSAVSWNVVLALYARVKDWRECLRLFDAMMAVGAAVPNEKTFVSILTACGSLGDLERGKWVHGLVRQRWERLVPDVLLLTALLTMYVKCGVMETAREIFDSMTERSVPSWNSMIIGYGLHGQSETALELFLEMERSGPKPNETTFVCVLSSCAHGGLLLEDWWCFDRMVRLYGVEPKAEHFGCMMDLLGRAGLLTGSESLVQNLQGKASPALWGAMVSASRTQNSSKLGEFVGKKLIEMKPAEVGPYVLLSNIYAAEGRWDDVEKVREMMKENGVEKDVGLSLVGSSEAEPCLGIEDGVVLSMLGEMGAHLKLPSESEQPRCREGKGGHKLLCVTTEGSNGSQKSKPGARPYFSSSNAAALFPPPEPKQQRPPSDCSTKGRGQTPPVQAFHQPPAGTGGKANLTSPSRGAAGIYRPTGFATTATADKAARAPEEKPESTSSRSAPYPRKKHRASPTETTTRLHSLLYRAPPGQIRLPLPTQRRQGRPGEREAQI